MKPTPRTDQAVDDANWPHGTWVLASFALELERELDEAKTLAGELIAMIRVNVMRGTFRDATIEQVDEHLRPWIERLNGKARQL